jgi:predicted nucleotidyltransferase
MLSVRSDPSPPAVLAAQAVEELKLLPSVVGLCVLGSVARGDERPDSDVDILVATWEPLAPRTMLAALPERLRARPLSLVSKTPEGLQRLAEEGSLFLAHARTEGRGAGAVIPRTPAISPQRLKPVPSTTNPDRRSKALTPRGARVD